MDKKTKIIYISLAIFVIIVLILSWIVNKKEENGNFTCTGNNQEWSFEIENDEISKIYLKLIKSSTDYNYDTLNNITTSQKQEIEKEILYDFGIDKLNYDGVQIKISYSDNLIIEINIDYSKANTDILKAMGLNYDKSIKFSTLKSLLNENKIFTCK